MSYRTRFLELALECDALRFGQFTLKSGRVSPYFFDAGRFRSGAVLARLAGCYADAVEAAGIRFDMLFGPAYKGIALATALALEFARRGRDLPLAFDRKEAKDHGEGGRLIGAPPAGRVLVVDDVVTAGTAVRAALALLRGAGAQPCALVIGLDRRERGDGPHSAVRDLNEREGIEVIAVADLDDLLQFAAERPALAVHREALMAYRVRHGV
ncbi:MAG TPA: orotate phosphoribosyltransferase [Xanthomonadaceae bacterium]|nr:orotate phosphoribosyltransferase [Xanthomonadaceae bacterium]